MYAPSFQWAAIVFGMILGVGVTQILSAFASAFRSRHTVPIDCVSLLWAICIFVMQLELWWSYADLGLLIKRWTFPLFLFFIMSPLLLFFASAVVLPNGELIPGENHQELFETHGKWALLAISVYFMESLFETIYFWKASVFELWAVLNVLLIILPVIAFFTPRRIHRILVVAILGVVIVYAFVDESISVPPELIPGA